MMTIVGFDASIVSLEPSESLSDRIETCKVNALFEEGGF